MSLPKNIHLPRRRCFLYVLLTSLSLYFIFSDSDNDELDDIPMIHEKDILRVSFEETSKNLTLAWSYPTQCDYQEVLRDDTILSSSLVDADLVEGHRIKEGGEYSPYNCKPKYSVAIIVPYRDRGARAEQLRGFLVYMHTFLRRQLIHYRIFVVEEVDTQPYSRSKLMNIGALAAMKAGYPCLVMHDMDMLPLKSANLYSCTKCTRHMDPNHKLFSYSTFRGGFIAASHMGSAIAIRSEIFKFINGYSLKKGDSDDLRGRLAAFGLDMCKFDNKFNLYHRMEDKTVSAEFKRKMRQHETTKEIAADGLSSLKYSEIATVLHPIFTHIMVDLA